MRSHELLLGASLAASAFGMVACSAAVSYPQIKLTALPSPDCDGGLPVFKPVANENQPADTYTFDLPGNCTEGAVDVYQTAHPYSTKGAGTISVGEAFIIVCGVLNYNPENVYVEVNKTATSPAFSGSINLSEAAINEVYHQTFDITTCTQAETPGL